MHVVANIVEDYDLLINKGDILRVIGSGGQPELIIVCPMCGNKTSGRHRYDPVTISLTPSIVHNKSLGGCGYHGYLINGVFTEC